MLHSDHGSAHYLMRLSVWMQSMQTSTHRRARGDRGGAEEGDVLLARARRCGPAQRHHAGQDVARASRKGAVLRNLQTVDLDARKLLAPQLRPAQTRTRFMCAIQMVCATCTFGTRCNRIVPVQAARAAPSCSSTRKDNHAKATKSRAAACLIEAQLSTPQEGLRNLTLKGRLRPVTQAVSAMLVWRGCGNAAHK